MFSIKLIKKSAIAGLILLFFLNPLCYAHPAHQHETPDVSPNNPKVAAFINKMVKDHQFKRSWLNYIFQQATYQQKAIDLIRRPAEKTLTWGQYRKIFIQPDRIQMGVDYYKKHYETFMQIEKKYNIPPFVILGILGVETKFGRNQGNYKTIDALATLAFYSKKRYKLFRRELEKFLIMTRKHNLPTLKLTSSYAGAMGIPQFIPSSYLHFAVPFGDKDNADIWDTPDDAISSVANYIRLHKWQPGEKIAVRVTPKGTQYKSLLSKKSLPNTTVRQAEKKGFILQDPLPANTKVRALQLQSFNGPLYWLTTINFYAITRYNHSDLYAMAVFELGEAIESAYNKQKRTRK